MSVSTAGGRGTLPFKAPELFAQEANVTQAANI